MTAVVDHFGKTTISLGGRCPLQCRHCYITAPQFKTDAKRSVDDAVRILERDADTATTVCISGDVDCFIKPKAGLELIQRVAHEFPRVDVMYTTRLCPPDEVVTGLTDLASEMAGDGRLIVPGISFVSHDYPNAVESHRLVPSTTARIEFMRELAGGPQPTFAALRPTFPFSVVPRYEIDRLIEAVAPSSACVLGEVMILDGAGVIASQLGIEVARAGDAVEAMTFLDQPATWRKRTHTVEHDYARQVAQANGVPYFLRSMSAMRYLKTYWDLRRGRSTHTPGDPIDLSIDGIRP
jgi:hypothetical protein